MTPGLSLHSMQRPATADLDIATELQAEMFGTANALGGLSLQLCYFRGLGEFFASDWHEKVIRCCN